MERALVIPAFPSRLRCLKERCLSSSVRLVGIFPNSLSSPLLFLFFLFTRPWWCRQRAKGIEPSRAILESHLHFFFFFRLNPNRKRERKKIFLLKGSDWLDIVWILSVASAASVVVYIYFPWMDRTTAAFRVSRFWPKMRRTDVSVRAVAIYFKCKSYN